MDTERIFELISEARSVGILLESDMQVNKQDENIINIVKVMNDLLGRAIDNIIKEK